MQRKAKEDTQRAAMEEEGKEGVVDQREFHWRMRLLDFRSKGESISEGEADEALKNLCSYEGALPFPPVLQPALESGLCGG